METLEKLIQRAIDGDNTAFESLYNATATKMLGRARSMVKNEEDAQDILQESYISAFKSLDTLENPEYFETWLYRIVTNRCKNYLTRTRPKLFASSLTDEEGIDFLVEEQSIDFQPAQQADNAVIQRMVLEMVDNLPEDQRACVLLYYYQEMNVEEIASELEVSPNTIKSRLHYGRKKIKVQAEEEQRKGTVLYGVSIIPFIKPIMEFIIREESAVGAGAVFSATMGSLGLAEAGVSVVSTATGAATATTTVAGVVGVKAFLGTVVGKIIVGVAAAAVVATVGYGAVKNFAPSVASSESSHEISTTEHDTISSLDTVSEVARESGEQVTLESEMDQGEQTEGVHRSESPLVSDSALEQAESTSSSGSTSGEESVSAEETTEPQSFIERADMYVSLLDGTFADVYAIDPESKMYFSYHYGAYSPMGKLDYSVILRDYGDVNDWFPLEGELNDFLPGMADKEYNFETGRYTRTDFPVDSVFIPTEDIADWFGNNLTKADAEDIMDQKITYIVDGMSGMTHSTPIKMDGCLVVVGLSQENTVSYTELSKP